jgi:hypothetical protein
MLYYNAQDPNKYSFLKKRIVPKDIDSLTRKRYGKPKDGSYVFAEELFNNSRIISYGINSDPDGTSFEESVFTLVDEIHMYDGTIEKYPARETLPSNSKFFKENVYGDNFHSHFDKIFNKEDDKYLIKMDIDGWEYDVIQNNQDIFKKYISQISFECHGLIEEHPPEWDVEEIILNVKKDKQLKIDFFDFMNKHFVLFHAHANNHCPTYVDFPETLELLYINKKELNNVDYKPCEYKMPIEGLDFPNYDGREDYILNWWL